MTSMNWTWGYEMGWLVKDELPEKKRQQLMEDAKPALLPGERVLDATGGIVQVHRFGGDQGRRGTLAVTDRRVIIQTKRVGGYDVQDFAYGLLSGCNYATGAGFSTIELVMARRTSASDPGPEGRGAAHRPADPAADGAGALAGRNSARELQR